MNAATAPAGGERAPGSQPAPAGMQTAVPHGVPHFASVIATAVSLGGEVALSRDGHGEVRLWPALDGSAAPRVVEVKPTTMRVQVGASGILVGLADASGTGYLLRYRRDGEIASTTRLAAGDASVVGVVPLGDASSALVVRADQRVELVAPDGASLGSLALRGARIVALEAFGASDAMAIVQSGGSDSVEHKLVRLAGGTRLVQGAERTLPHSRVDPAALAIAPGGARVAYFYEPGPPPAAGRPAPSPPVRRPARVAVVDVATGKDLTPAELKDLDIPDRLQLGFTSADRLHVFANTSDWTVGIARGSVVAGMMSRAVVPATGDGVIVGGADRFVLHVAVATGEMRYLGHATTAPIAAALSDDGSRVAWATRDGHVVIERVGAPGEVAGPRYDRGVGLMRFVGTDHLLVVGGDGVAHLLDATTGQERTSLLVGSGPAQMQYHARRRWLAGPRAGGGVWIVAVNPRAAQPLRLLGVVPDGSFHVAIVDAADDDRALWTIDGRQQLRSYSAHEIATGVTPSMVRDRPVRKVARIPQAFDRRGWLYTIEGRRVLVRAVEPTIADPSASADPNADVVATIPLSFDARGIAPFPDRRAVIVLRNQHSLEALALDGTHLWSASIGTMGATGWGFSDDGRRFVVVTPDGGQIFDTATGQIVATGCGWRFGAFDSPPPSASLHMPPICRR